MWFPMFPMKGNLANSQAAQGTWFCQTPSLMEVRGSPLPHMRACTDAHTEILPVHTGGGTAHLSCTHMCTRSDTHHMHTHTARSHMHAADCVSMSLLCRARCRSWRGNAGRRVSSSASCPATWSSSGSTPGPSTCWAAALWLCQMPPRSPASLSHSS